MASATVSPCPNCGAVSNFKKLRWKHINTEGVLDAYFLVCPQCKAKTEYCPTEDEALALWNSGKVSVKAS